MGLPSWSCAPRAQFPRGGNCAAGDPGRAARLQARDLDSIIGRRSRALTPEMNI